MPTTITFTCNICTHESLFQPEHYFDPELPSCGTCGSNVRFRWLVQRLSLELFGRSIPLPQFPANKSIMGLGLTDSNSMAGILEQRFTYVNTYLHKEPRFDIARDPSPLGKLDFLIASEVFEHVEPPVLQAFHNAATILKPSGFVLLTVPWIFDGDIDNQLPEFYDWKLCREPDSWTVLNRRLDGQTEAFNHVAVDGGPGPSFGGTREHFPHLHEWVVSKREDDWLLVNRRRTGEVEEFHNLVFHGGPGLALEMRLFTKSGLEESLRSAGFRSIQFESGEEVSFGIIFPYPWSRPVVARLSR